MNETSVLDSQIVGAMGAMVFLTISTMVILLMTRIWHVRKGLVSFSYFKVFDASKPVPLAILKTSRHVTNQFELPVLFYAGCLASMHVHKVDALMVNLAWLFVGSRVVHSFIHLTFNVVPLRLPAFLTGSVTLGVIWLRILM